MYIRIISDTKTQLVKKFLYLFFILLIAVTACGPEVEDNPYSPCQSALEAPPEEIPTNLKRLMAGFLEHHYWLFTNPQGDSVVITADSNYTISKIPNPECAGCENCPDMFELRKTNFLVEYKPIDTGMFPPRWPTPFDMTITMNDAESPAEIKLMASDDMLWDIEKDEITDSDEIPEIWRFKGQTTLGGQSYPAVFYRDPLGKINFDRGYIWYHTPSIGPIAYVDHRGVRLNENHDTLTLKAYY